MVFSHNKKQTIIKYTRNHLTQIYLYTNYTFTYIYIKNVNKRFWRSILLFSSLVKENKNSINNHFLESRQVADTTKNVHTIIYEKDPKNDHTIFSNKGHKINWSAMYMMTCVYSEQRLIYQICVDGVDLLFAF